MDNGISIEKIKDKTNHGLYTIEVRKSDKPIEDSESNNIYSSLIDVIQEHIDGLLHKFDNQKEVTRQK